MTPAEKAAVEVMARALFSRHHISRAWEREPSGFREGWLSDGAAALTALTTLHPGIGAVLRGEAVVVPREATEKILKAGVMTLTMPWSSVIPPDEDADTYIMAMVWAEMLAASPYATPPTPGDAKEGGEAAPSVHARWAAERWHAEVENRPLVNIHRRSLDDTWRQVIRHFGGDDEMLVGPRHDDLLARRTSPYATPPTPGDAKEGGV